MRLQDLTVSDFLNHITQEFVHTNKLNTCYSFFYQISYSARRGVGIW